MNEPTPVQASDDWELETPVVLVIFNRPDKVRQVLERISEAEPSELYVVADGPREGHSKDEERCMAARSVVEEVDWDCVVRRNYADENLGLARRMPTGLDWVFDHVERAIILEDDCVPDPSFFRFCQALLEEYEGDERVWDVTGTNPLVTWKDDRQDYHFSSHGMIWGWATWRRSWRRYDFDMERWADPDVRDRVRDYLADEKQFRWASRLYQRTYEGEIETWDYQWGFAKSVNFALSIIPSRNLVSNIGFDEEATNTDAEDSLLAGLSTHSLDSPPERDSVIGVDRDYDRRFYQRVTTKWERNPILRRVRNLFVEASGRL